jgi:hypothetical protein
VLAGLGGELAETLDIVAVRPAPLSHRTAAGLLDEVLGGSGPDRADRAGLVAAVTALGALLAAVPELDVIEVNPLRVPADGRPVALDVVVTAPGAGTVEPVVAVLADGQGGL